MNLPANRPPLVVAGRSSSDGQRLCAAAVGLSASPAERTPAHKEGEASSAAQHAPYRRGDLIYGLGTLDYDLGSEAHRDFLVQYLRPTSPYDREGLMAHLEQHPLDAEWLTWIVKVDEVPILALHPEPTFGREVYAWLRQVFTHPGHEHAHDEDQSTRNVELLVSIPGTIAGCIGLSGGQVVPVVTPEVGGLFAWEMGAIERVTLQGTKVDKQVHQKILQHVELFQRNAARELRNVGRSPRERALNYAVTAAFQYTEDLALSFVRTQAAAQGAPGGSTGDAASRSAARAELGVLRQVWQEKGDLELSYVDVQPSPICRPGSADHCWDVKLVLFNPAAGLNQAGIVYQFTVDISEPQPVVIGEMQQWATVLLTPRS